MAQRTAFLSKLLGLFCVLYSLSMFAHRQAALDGVGVCSPGAVDTVAGTVARAGNLSGWTEPFPLAAVLSE